MNLAVALDHIGVVAHDFAALVAQYERLGFTLTPRAVASGGRIHNRCVMLRHGYLELMALAPGGTSATLERFLTRHEGAHIIALAIDDETETLARLRRAGIESAGPEQSDRPIDAADPNGPHASFVYLPVPEQPEGRINLIRHLTPELLWQERFLSHPNHVVTLEDVVLTVPAPAETAARFSRLAGRPVMPDPERGYALELSRGTLRLLPSDTAAAVPSITGITLLTDDANAAIMEVLARDVMTYRSCNDTITVPPMNAGGVALRFKGPR